MNRFIDKVEDAIYGPNGQSGLIGSDRKLGREIEGKISRTWLIGIAVSIVAILSAIFIPILSDLTTTLKVVSDRSIAMQVTTDRTIIDVAKMDLSHRDFVQQMDERNREVHGHLLDKITGGDGDILDRMQKGNVELLNHFTAAMAKMEVEIEKDIERAIEIAVSKALTSYRKKNYDEIREREIP